MPASTALLAFRVRSFRFQWPADLLVSCAFEMEVIVLGWYILVETNSVLLLTVFGALQFGGTLISPLVGVVSDRIGPRNLLTMMRLAYMAVALTYLGFALAGALSPVVVLVLVAIMGIVRPSDLGLRATLIADTVPSDVLTGAMGMSRITSDGARVAGALAGAGLFATLGMAATYAAIAVFYATGAFLTSRAAAPARDEAPAAEPATRISALGDLKAGAIHIWTTPSLMAIMWLVLLFNFTAFPLTNGLMPYVAREIYRVDQAGLSYLIASIAFGAMIGSVLMGRVGLGPRLARLMIGSALIWHTLLIVFVQMPSIGPGIVALMAAGVFQSLTMVTLMVILVRETAPRFRGRVMGVRMMAIYSLPVGLMIAGGLIERIGYGATATIYAATGFVMTAVIALCWRAQMWPARAPAQDAHSAGG